MKVSTVVFSSSVDGAFAIGVKPLIELNSRLFQQLCSSFRLCLLPRVATFQSQDLPQPQHFRSSQIRNLPLSSKSLIANSSLANIHPKGPTDLSLSQTTPPLWHLHNCGFQSSTQSILPTTRSSSRSRNCISASGEQAKTSQSASPFVLPRRGRMLVKPSRFIHGLRMKRARPSLSWPAPGIPILESALPR